LPTEAEAIRDYDVDVEQGPPSSEARVTRGRATIDAGDDNVDGDHDLDAAPSKLDSLASYTPSGATPKESEEYKYSVGSFASAIMKSRPRKGSAPFYAGMFLCPFIAKSRSRTRTLPA
jgi:hypothetical protein